MLKQALTRVDWCTCSKTAICGLQGYLISKWCTQTNALSPLLTNPHAQAPYAHKHKENLTAMRCRAALTAAHRSCRRSMTRMKPTSDAAALQREARSVITPPKPLLCVCASAKIRTGCVLFSQYLVSAKCLDIRSNHTKPPEEPSCCMSMHVPSLAVAQSSKRISYQIV